MTADPESGRIVLLGRDPDDRLLVLVSADHRRWTPLAVPFPEGWEPGAITARGDTLVITGGRQVGVVDPSGAGEDEDWREEPLVSLDGGATWAVSSGWPSLMDPLTRAAIGEGVIVAGAEYPTSAIFLETP